MSVLDMGTFHIQQNKKAGETWMYLVQGIEQMAFTAGKHLLRNSREL